MDALRQDLRYALRGLRRSPGFTAVAVLTLALGIGAATAVFTVLRGVVLAPLPYPNAERLVQLQSAVPGVAPDERWQLSTAQYFLLEEEAKSFEEIGAFQRGSASFTGETETLRVRLGTVTGETLRIIGARAALGRIFDEAELAPDGPAVAVLDHAFWRRTFGSDAGVIGRSVVLNHASYEIVGVMAPGVELPGEAGVPPLRQDVWLPYRLNPAGPFQNSHHVPTLARLRPGISLEAARAELERVTARLPDAYPQVYPDGWIERLGFRTVAVPLKEAVVGEVAGTLWIVFGAMGLVLLVAWANVGNLLLARFEARRRELAVRGALGAGARDLARHLLAETLLLALLGAAFALLLGLGGVRWLIAVAPDTFPRLEAVFIGPAVLGFSILMALGAGFGLTGLLLLRWHGRWTAALLAAEGRSGAARPGRQRIRAGLVVSQVAMALVLVVTAALLLESFDRLRAVDPGFEPEGTMVVRAHLPPSRYSDFAGGMPEVWRLFQPVLERIRALPGVTAAGVAGEVPLSGGYGCWGHEFEDAAVLERLRDRDEGSTTCAALVPTSPEYLEALAVPILAGRAFVDADNDVPETGAVIVSNAFAERFWPGEDPIGKGVQPFGGGMPFYRVVGVAGDVPASTLEGPPALAIYYPLVPIPETASWLLFTGQVVVRVDRGSPLELLTRIRSIVRDADPSVALFEAEEMSAVLERATGGLSFVRLLLAVSAGAALALAAVGLYGMISYLVTRRTPEIGIRIALGARPRQVEGHVLAQAIRLLAVGLAIGVLGALALTRVAAGLLYEIEPTHPAAYLAAAALLVGVALIASWIPARRAARVDPMVALRAE